MFSLKHTRTPYMECAITLICSQVTLVANVKAKLTLFTSFVKSFCMTVLLCIS